jgi:hypothetical protein
MIKCVKGGKKGKGRNGKRGIRAYPKSPTVIPSAAKDLLEFREILRFAQDDKYHFEIGFK